MTAPAPDRTERLIGAAALALLLVVAVAVARGAPHWASVPGSVWLHMLAATTALALSPALLWSQRGTPRHRVMGYLWVAAIAFTAAASFAVQQIRPGHFSLIHLLSAWTLLMLPMVVVYARRGQHSRHRQAVRGLIIGALLIAGAFTFLPSRILGHWLFG